MAIRNIILWQERVFDLVVTISLILSGFSLVGFTNLSYIYTVDLLTRAYVCLFLLWRFNVFQRKTTFTNFDRKIAFTAGAILLTTGVLNNIGLLLRYHTNVFGD
jgi:hypothetical protein